jgi:hypothetical protein
MSEKEEDFQFELPKDNDAGTEAPVKVENSEDRSQDSVDSELVELRKRYEQEKLARQEAENRAHTAMLHAEKASTEVEDTNLHLVNSAIDTVKREQDILKAHYREAMSVGDYDKVADLQAEMSTNAAKLLQLENGKAAMENRPAKQPVQPMQRAVNPVEDFASRLSPRSAAWIRKNPQCVTDQNMMRKMIAAHELAVTDGVEPDSDEYFGLIENTLKIRPRETSEVEDNPMSEASAPTQRRSGSVPPAAAPVARAGNATGTRQNVVRLSAEEREHAASMGMKPEEYARNKMLLIKEGKLTQH